MYEIDLAQAKRVAARVVLITQEGSPGNEHHLKGAEKRFKQWLMEEGLGDHHETVWTAAVRENWEGTDNGQAD